ncbi:MAG: dTDP-4-dehydrorhamnose reductase [Spirochaetia bacterium]|nr:dTDP-4-dehydrorhamnose reductase [Spirochaetia bacterium]
MKVLVFGGTGLLGTDIIEACKDEYKMVKSGSAECDITDAAKVYDFVKTHRPDVVINSAAITDVDKCESDHDTAFKINAMGPKNIAIACRDFNARLMHISTDYVFDGKKGDSYSEFDKPNPINVYGQSKLLGEELVQTSGAKYMIIRTAWIFGSHRKHFVDYVAESITNGTEIVAVKDMVSSPTFSVDLADTIKALIPLNQYGVFHACNKGYCSRVQMVEEIMKIMRKTTRVQVMNQSQWKRPAARPVFSALKNYHLHLMDIDTMAGWRDALKRYIKYKYNV